VEAGALRLNLDGTHTLYRKMPDPHDEDPVEDAMLRTRHPGLHTIDTLMSSQNQVARISDETAARLAGKSLSRFTTPADLACIQFWLALHALQND